MTIYFDMDGTIANLYGVEGWLNDLMSGNVRPYAEAEALLDFSEFTKIIHLLQARGYKIGIISWLAKCDDKEYHKAVAATKKAWLKKLLPAVVFDEIHIVKYGTPKSTCGNGILFDDEEPNRKEWKGIAFDVDNIIETLKRFL